MNKVPNLLLAARESIFYHCFGQDTFPAVLTTTFYTDKFKEKKPNILTQPGRTQVIKATLLTTSRENLTTRPTDYLTSTMATEQKFYKLLPRSLFSCSHFVTSLKSSNHYPIINKRFRLYNQNETKVSFASFFLPFYRLFQSLYSSSSSSSSCAETVQHSAPRTSVPSAKTQWPGTSQPPLARVSFLLF